MKVCTSLKLKASKDQCIELQASSTNKLLVTHQTFSYFIFRMLVLLMLYEVKVYRIANLLDNFTT